MFWKYVPGARHRVLLSHALSFLERKIYYFQQTPVFSLCMSFSFFLIQSLSILALILFALSFHAKTREGILAVNTTSLIVWMLHFALLQAWTGTILIGMNIILSILLLFKAKQNIIASPLFLLAAALMLSIATVLTWEGFYSLFALGGIISIILAKWQNDASKIRIIAILASLCWIGYDYCVGSSGGIISESLIIVSIGISLVRKKGPESGGSQ